MRKTAEVWPMASFLQEELDARKWSWDYLASMMGVHVSYVERIMGGERLGSYAAEGLARAFGTSAGFWLRLDAHFWASLKCELAEQGQPQERPER